MTTELEKLIEARAANRKLYPFHISDFLNSPTIDAQIFIRVGTKGEEVEALNAAEKYIKNLFGGSSPDSAVAQDVKTVFLMQKLIRDGESEDMARERPAFSSAEAMLKVMTGDELSKLLGLVNSVAALESPWKTPFDASTFETFIVGLAAMGDNDASLVLGRVERGFLEQSMLEAARRILTPKESE